MMLFKWLLSAGLLVVIGRVDARNEETVDGVLYVNDAWGMRPGGRTIPLVHARFPDTPPANMVQTWRAVALMNGAVRIACSEITLPRGDGTCRDYSFTIEDGRNFKQKCGGTFKLNELWENNEIRVKLRTGKEGAGVVVNCTIQAREMGPYGEVTEPPTTPAPPPPPQPTLPAYLTMESEEIDSSEHGGPPGPVATTCPCGRANKHMTKIISGEEAKINEYPFAVMLTYKDQYVPFCGGSIITGRHVLTAAHCVVGLSKDSTISVGMGDHDFTEERTPHKRIVDVSEVIIHEEYSEKKHYDIAILVLSETIEFTKYISPVCLPSKQLALDWKYLKAIGWGRTGWAENDGLSPYLKMINVRAVPLSLCSRYANVVTSDPHQLCTYGRKRGLGQGDSGGPVIWLDPATNRYTIVGLPSFVYMFFGQNYRPDVTTDVSSFLPWIHKQIKNTPGSVQACWSKN